LHYPLAIYFIREVRLELFTNLKTLGKGIPMKRKYILIVLLLAVFVFPLGGSVNRVNAEVETPGLTKCNQNAQQIRALMSATCKYANNFYDEVEDMVFPYQQIQINMQIKSANLIDYACDESFKETSTLDVCTGYWNEMCKGARELELQNNETEGVLIDRISTTSGNESEKGNALEDKIQKIKNMYCSQ
jgi:hypothetical protein